MKSKRASSARSLFVSLTLALAVLLGSVLSALAAPPASPPAFGDIVTRTYGDPGDLYLTFTLSGADFSGDTTEDATFYGTYTGQPIHFSGTMRVDRSGGGKSYVNMSASLAGQEVKWPENLDDSDEVAGFAVERTFDFTFVVPPDYGYSEVSGSAFVQACGGVCGDYSVRFYVALPTPPPDTGPTETPTPPPPMPTPERVVTIRGTVGALDPASMLSWQPGPDSLVLPVVEATISLQRKGRLLDFTFTKPPDGSFEFQVPVTDSLVLSTTLLHAVTAPSAFKVVYDTADDAIWIATAPFDLDENTPDVLVKDVNLSAPEGYSSGPVPVPADQFDDVGLIYHYAREAWQMGAILLGQTLDFPTLKIRAFSSTPGAKDTAYWAGPWAGYPGLDPEIELSPKFSDFSKTGGPDTVMHEFGHHVMADSYDNGMPWAQGDTNHAGFANPTTTDSWIEGFATFYALWTKKEQIQARSPQLWVNQSTVENLELNYLAWSSDEEIAVSSLLWDLADPISGADATEMPVQNFATQPTIAISKTTSYGDYVSIERDELWRLLSAAELASVDRPPAAPGGYPYIYDVKQLYDTLQLNGVGLLLEATPNNLDAVDELFIAHGFFADTNPQNLAWDPGEEIGVTTNGPLTVAGTSYAARPVRRSPPPVDDSYLAYQVQDEATGGSVEVAAFEVSVEFNAPYEEYNYSYLTRPWGEGRLPYVGPPPYYPATTRITPAGPGIVPGDAVQFTNEEYWQLRTAKPTGAFLEHNFLVEVAADTGSEPGGLGSSDPWGEPPGISSAVDGLALPLLLLVCGGSGLLVVVGLLLVLFVVSRRRSRQPDRRTPSPREPSSAPLMPRPVAGPPPASPSSWADPVAANPGGTHGAAGNPSSWILVVLDGPAAGHRTPLGAETRLGRSSDADVVVEDPQASRQHALVQCVGDDAVVSDTGSRNGTFVNGARIDQPTWLDHGDTIRIGNTCLRLERYEAPDPGQAPSFCGQCGHSLPPGAWTCPSCGASQGTPTPPPAPRQTAGPRPASPAPERRGASPDAEPPVAWRDAPPEPERPVARGGEPIMGVVAIVSRRKGLFGTQVFNLIVTPQRLLFDRLTNEGLKDAVREARDAAKDEGKGFFGQWGAQLSVHNYIAQRYQQMSVDDIQRQHPDNFAVAVQQVRKVDLRSGDIEEGDPDQIVIHGPEKLSFDLKGTSRGDAKKILRQVLGDRVR